MKITIDKEAKVAYIHVIKNPDQYMGNISSEPVNENITLDYTPDGKLFGIEILNLNLLDLSEIE